MGAREVMAGEVAWGRGDRWLGRSRESAGKPGDAAAPPGFAAGAAFIKITKHPAAFQNMPDLSPQPGPDCPAAC